MRKPILGLIDERFHEHRRRSTSTAGIVAGSVSLLLFACHYYVDHQIRWELLAIGLIMVIVKYSLLFWYRYHD